MVGRAILIPAVRRAWLHGNPGTNKTMTNYDSRANRDDGSCKGRVLGCTDSRAENFDTGATVNNGNCRYKLSQSENQGPCSPPFILLVPVLPPPPRACAPSPHARHTDGGDQGSLALPTTAERLGAVWQCGERAHGEARTSAPGRRFRRFFLITKVFLFCVASTWPLRVSACALLNAVGASRVGAIAAAGALKESGLLEPPQAQHRAWLVSCA